MTVEIDLPCCCSYHQETEEELAAKRLMSLQEVKERRMELYRQKELQRRYERKAMLQNKSKSRK